MMMGRYIKKENLKMETLMEKEFFMGLMGEYAKKDILKMESLMERE